MKFTFSFVCSTLMILPDLISATSPSSDDNNIINALLDSFTFTGSGHCAQNGKSYDSISFDVPLDECASSLYCGNEQVRGFTYDSESGRCSCHLDNGYTMDTIHSDLKAYRKAASNNFSNSAVGPIVESSGDLSKICFSNDNFKAPYKLVGDGVCRDANNDIYNFVSFDIVETLEICGSPLYCGRPQIRGFTYDDLNHCVCYFEDGWKLDTIPSDLKTLPGYNFRGVNFGETASGQIMGTDNESMFRKCYSNNNFIAREIEPYKLIGNGACRDANDYLYNFVSYDDVNSLEMCGSSSYCGRTQVSGFTYDDMNHCVCYFEEGWSLDTIPSDMKTLPGYNFRGVNFGESASGEITGTDGDSMFRKCYSNIKYNNKHILKNDAFELIGHGVCTNANNERYDFVSFDDIETLDKCGSLLYCGRPQVRGFTYDDMNHCVCYFEDGWRLDTIPSDLKTLPGYNFRGVNFGETATGAIEGTDGESIFRKCYSNNNFAFRTYKSLRGSVNLEI